MVITGRYEGLGKKLCEMFGLDPNVTNQISLTINANDVVTLDARIYVSDIQLNEVITFMSDFIRYNNVKIVEKKFQLESGESND